MTKNAGSRTAMMDIDSVNKFYGDMTKAKSYGKYVVARIHGKRDGPSKIVVRAVKSGSAHRDAAKVLFDDFTVCDKTPTVTILGGGDIDCYLHRGVPVVVLHGRSGQFGADPDRAATIALIKTVIPRSVTVRSAT